MADTTECKDCCLISVPIGSRTSMRYEIAVDSGYNMVRKRLGTVVGYYPADNNTAMGVTLAPGSTWTSGANPSGVLISTDNPLQVTLVSGTISQVLNVNQLLVVDDTYSSVTIQNPSTATENAQVSVFYVVA